jgi:hypothetical protein
LYVRHLQVAGRRDRAHPAVRTSAPWVGIGSATWTSGRDFEFADTGPGAAINSNRHQLTTSTAANYTAAKCLAGSDGWNPVAP